MSHAATTMLLPLGSSSLPTMSSSFRRFASWVLLQSSADNRRRGGRGTSAARGLVVVAAGQLPPPDALILLLSDVLVDPWSPNTSSVDSQGIASQLFAASLFPYIGFLYHITRSKSAPKLTLFGFYFLLAFVAATIPAGIYAKLRYGTSLANVDWLHGGAESLLTVTNLFIVLGLRRALRDASSGDKMSTEESLKAVEEEIV